MGKLKHALLSASGSSRWLNCTPSPRLEEKIKSDDSSVYAQEGTLAHEYGETLLKGEVGLISKRTVKNRIKKFEANELYSQEMPNQVRKYTDYVIEQFNSIPEGILDIERKTDLATYIKEGFGTCDSVIIADGEMEIIDLKYGKGVSVSPENNSQLMLYALGAYDYYEFMYDIHSVKLTISQPRLNVLESWIISVKDLIKWGQNEVIPAADMAFEGKGIQKAGSWCRWCKVKAKCSTIASYSMAVVKEEFSDPHLLKDSQILDISKRLPVVLDWAKAVDTYMLKEALGGKKWPGMKLVEGRANRKWTDPDEVLQVLRDLDYDDDKIMDAKVKGIPALLKLLGDDFDSTIGSYVIKPQGKPALVPDTDKRPEFNNVKNDFK